MSNHTRIKAIVFLVGVTFSTMSLAINVKHNVSVCACPNTANTYNTTNHTAAGLTNSGATIKANAIIILEATIPQ